MSAPLLLKLIISGNKIGGEEETVFDKVRNAACHLGFIKLRGYSELIDWFRERSDRLHWDTYTFMKSFKIDVYVAYYTRNRIGCNAVPNRYEAPQSTAPPTVHQRAGTRQSIDSSAPLSVSSFTPIDLNTLPEPRQMAPTLQPVNPKACEYG